MDIAVLEQKLDTLGRNWEEFKKTSDEKQANLKKSLGVAELEEKLGKLTGSMDLIETLKKDVEAFKSAEARRATMRVDKKTGEQLPEDHVECQKSFRGFLTKGENGQAGGGGATWGYKTTSMSVLSDPDGGYLVPADMSGRIVEKVYETSDVRKIASVQQISSDALEGMYDTDEAGAEWVSETGTRNQTNTPQVGAWRIPVHELSAKPQATQKLLDDAKIDVEGWLARKVAGKFSRTENTAFVSGSGVGRPRGFASYTLVSGSQGSQASGGTVQKVKSGANGALDTTGKKLFDVVYALKGVYRTRASWGMNRTSIGKVRQLQDLYGQFLWQPGLQMGEPARLLGYAVNELNDLGDITTTGASAIWFADWAEFYQIVDRLGLRILRDPFTAHPYVKFITTKRVGGAVTNFEAGVAHTMES